MIRDITLHLYEFAHPDTTLPSQHRFQFVISSLTSDYIRGMFNLFEPEDTPQQIFHDTFEVGSCREIHYITDILPGDNLKLERILPFYTDEMVNCEELGGTYLGLGEISINEFFRDYSRKVFKSNF